MNSADQEEGKVHGYGMRGFRRWNLAMYVVSGIVASILTLCMFLSSARQTDPNGPASQLLDIPFSVSAICFLFGGLTWIDIRNSSVITYSDRVVFKTFPLYRPETIFAAQVSKLQSFAPRRTIGSGTDPSLVVQSGFRRYEIDRSITNWDELLTELEALTGKRVEN